MSRSEQDSAALVGTYGDLYNSIARPERKYAVSHYLRTRWAPLLGAARFWFVIALRQRCFWNGKQDWCIVDMETLARESGLSLRTINRIVAASDEPAGADEGDGSEIVDDRDGLVAWFFDKRHRRRYDRHVGRTVNAPNRYHVLLDDPLTPADQAALSHALRRALTDRSPEGTLLALQRLCERGLNTLHEKGDPVPADGGVVLPGAFVLDLVEAQCPLPERESVLYAEIGRAASRLHNILTRPEHVYIGNQYFRLQWLPELGPALSSLVVNLRARCYWNEQTGELRDTCQASWSELADEIGCTSRQLRNLRQEPYLSRFLTVLHAGRGRAASEFQVCMADPLTDADQDTFADRLSQQEGLQVDPETGQLDAYALLQKPELLAHTALAGTAIGSPLANAETLAPGGPADPEVLASRTGLNAEVLACGAVHAVEKTAPGAVDSVERTAPGETPNAELLAFREAANPETMALGTHGRSEILAGRERKIWQLEGLNAEILALEPGRFGTTEQIHLITPTLQGLTATALPLTAALAADEDALAAAVRDRLFDQLDIQQPGRGKLYAQHPRCDWIVAWGLYALAQPRLSENKAGYIYRRLVAQDPPPPEALLLAGLSPPAWRALYRAQRYGDDERRVDASLHAALAAWRVLLGPVWPALEIELGAPATRERTMGPVSSEVPGAGEPPVSGHVASRTVRGPVPAVPLNGAPVTTEPAADQAAVPRHAAVGVGRAPDLEGSPAQGLPPPLTSLLHGKEGIACTDEGCEIVSRDLYPVYQLARAVQQHGLEDAVSVVYRARDGREYVLNAEVLAYELEELPSGVWHSVEKELPLRLSGREQKRMWHAVEPLGIGSDSDAGEGVCVVLCVPDEEDCEWLRAFHSTLAAEMIGAVLGKPVRICFYAHRPVVLPEPSLVPP